jgi:hypothetical protein
MRDIQGIERWDDQVLSPVRPVTKALAAIFACGSQADLDP